ncbi:MAG: sugar porter family MFS transporter [Chitinophagaceae bacterium]|nr:sugar porter family MFS transporter [Chitinophagaceae bacterium]MCA6453475.1 sugar porter family MFS transporter [Chitinophagaceae bacterium]MCA6457048.1 sugar porter family MFS transporter [Chitinophagaceae bacterium]MCA6460435.1 sugar porter family MFS transporter [Chitinophagaceae bacterium]MCA6465322.1 sugar porter family MFS transporter [Chitinophagaceae bacterium]
MKNVNKVNIGFLTLLTITAALGGFLFGFDTAVISGTISFVKEQYHMSTLMEGWYVSSALVGCIAGVAITGKLSNLSGRKKVMFLSALLFIISVIGCAITPGVFMLIIFRLIGGVGIGVSSVICPMYLSEMAPANLRGKLVTYYQLAITIGILLAYFSNSYIQASASPLAATGWAERIFILEPWRGMFAVGIIPAVVFLLMSFFIPESPRWLALQNRTQEADSILTKISGREYAAKEMVSIRDSLSPAGSLKITTLFSGKLRRPLFIGILLAALSQFSGINAIIYYGPSILEKAGFQLGEALGGQVTIGIVNMLFTVVAIYFIDKAGRKPLLLWGIGGAVFSLLLASLLFATDISGGWLVLVPVILFIACFAFSFGPVTWVVVSEIFPTGVRAEAVAISTMSLWIANWIVGQFFPVLLNGAGASVTFLVFALCSVYAFYITWKKIPETKGKSLEEIEKFWNG